MPSILNILKRNGFKLTPEARVKLDAILEAIQAFTHEVDDLADFIPYMEIRAPIEIGAKALGAVAEFIERVNEAGGGDLTPDSK